MSDNTSKLTKEEAIKKFVSRDLDAVPQEWVGIVAEHYGEYLRLPMWDTMWIVEDSIGEELVNHSRIMAESTEDIDLDNLDTEERQKVEQAIANDPQDWVVLERYINEEMAGERCILDKNGNPTSLFVYEIDGRYVIGVNGAGWDFYSGVWDKLYDLLGLEWHKEQ